MALTGTEETDLLLPLIRGGLQESLFPTFLDRLRRRTQALHVALVLRRESREPQRLAIAHAGADLDGQSASAGDPGYHAQNRIHYEQMRPGRVYAVGELIEHDPLARAARAHAMRPLGVVDERVVRLTGAEDWAGWLVLARAQRCHAEDSALLSSLVPYLNAAFDQRETLDRLAREARLAEASLERSGNGWILFDREARVLTIDHATRAYWADHCGAVPRPGERLLGLSPTAQRLLAASTAQLSDDAAMAPPALALHEDPWIEALLVPAPRDYPANAGGNAVLAICNLPRTDRENGAHRFAAVHDLPLREAQLAMGLASGQSLAETGAALGLTLETTRNYSKRLYAKLGVRGQAELVRLVYRGTALFG